MDSQARYSKISRGIRMVLWCVGGSIFLVNVANFCLTLGLPWLGYEVEEAVRLSRILRAWLTAIPLLGFLFASWGVYGATMPFPTDQDPVTKTFGWGIRILFGFLLVVMTIGFLVHVANPFERNELLGRLSIILSGTLMLACLLEMAVVFYREKILSLGAAAVVVAGYYVLMVSGAAVSLIEDLSGEVAPNSAMEMHAEILFGFMFQMLVLISFMVLLFLVPIAVRKSLREAEPGTRPAA